MGEVLEVFRDQEEMEDAFVDEFEIGDGLVGFGMEDGEAEANLVTRTWIARSGGEAERVFDGVREAGDELHAAARADSGFKLPDVGVHWAEEFNGFFSRFLRQQSRGGSGEK